MNTEFFNALDLLEREKGIPKEYMMERVSAALTSAFKRELGDLAEQLGSVVKKQAVFYRDVLIIGHNERIKITKKP